MSFDHTEWAGQCHAASLALVRELREEGTVARVARGVCKGVGAQHSWVVLGDNCYAQDAAIIDPTLWSYDSKVDGVWRGYAFQRPHIPHGTGSIWEYGKPQSTGGMPIELDVKWSPMAEFFLGMVGPLDMRGWGVLSHAPVGGWPAAEIIGALWDDERTQHLVPIDLAGMLTDRNPGGLYF